MGSKTSSSVKVKVTASLDSVLVKAMDDYLKESETRSRSKLIEDILRYWHKEQKRRRLEAQIEEYYLSLSREEQEKDQQWCETTARSAHLLWEK